MKVRSNDMAHCFRHARTHRVGEPCDGCEVERLRRELVRAELGEFERLQRQLRDARQRVKPLVDREREAENIGDVLDFRVQRPTTTARNEMKTRCKFECVEVTKQTGKHFVGNPQFVYNARFQTVYGDSEENKQFFAATPNGSITVATMRHDQFEPGRAYYVDFTLIEAPAAAPTGG